MALSIQSARFAITATATNTQDLDISGFGTPKAAIFVVTRAASGDDHAPEAAISIGFTDGNATTPNNRCFGGKDEHDVATSNTSRHQSDASCGLLVNPSADTVDGSFSFSAWTANGVQITVDNTFSGQYYVQVTLFGGTDIANVWVNHHDDLGTGTTPVSVQCGDGGTTQADFQADLVFIAHVGSNTAITGDDVQTFMLPQFGVWSADDATQRWVGVGDNDAQGTTAGGNYSDSNNGTGQSHASVGWQGTVAADANGFTVDPSQSSGSDIIGFLAIEWASVPNIEIVGSDLGASGDWAESGFTFAPDWGMSCFCCATSHDSIITSGAMGIMVATYETGQVLSSGISWEDGVTQTVTSSWGKDTFFFGDPDATAVLDEGTLSSMDANGWTIGLAAGTHDGVARKGWSIAIETSAAPPAGGSPSHLTLLGVG